MESTFVADNFIFAGKQKLVYFTRCLLPFTKGRIKKKVPISKPAYRLWGSVLDRNN
jgi:hypothetical protein